MKGPEEILTFWLDEVGEERWYAQDEALDARVRDQFEETWEAAMEGRFGLWLTYPSGALAYIVLLDQFPRNMFRGSGRSFESNDLALRHAGAALDHGFDQQVEATARQFFYLPFMHSEDLQDQDRAVRLYEALGDESSLRFARQHREIIARFGRFPHRNAVLARESTPDETEFLKTHQGF